MIARCIRELCALSVFCAVAMQLTPEGGVRRMLSILCTAALLSAALSGVRQIDYDAYALELSRVREREKSFAADTDRAQERLSRLVIEQECRTYIEDKARQLGLEPEEIEVELRWDMEGLWVPAAVTIRCRGTEGQIAALSGAIRTELGIAGEDQRWVDEDGREEDSGDAG